jgi:hypothetical protein
MQQRRRDQQATVLLILLVLGLVYAVLLQQFDTLTGRDWLDGVIGVVLGLYICAHPAAHTIDLFFRERRGLQWAGSLWTGVAWLILNAVVLLVGWLAIFVGVIRLAL